MEQVELIDVLRGTVLFAGFKDSELEAVPKVGLQRTHSAGEIIIAAGAGHPESLFVVLDGEVGVEIGGEDITTLGPGEHFGEMALLSEGAPRSADVVALEATTTFELHRSHLLGLISSAPEIALAVMAELAGRLRSTTELVREIVREYPEAAGFAAGRGVGVTDDEHHSVSRIDYAIAPDPGA